MPKRAPNKITCSMSPICLMWRCAAKEDRIELGTVLVNLESNVIVSLSRWFLNKQMQLSLCFRSTFPLFTLFAFCGNNGANDRSHFTAIKRLMCFEQKNWHVWLLWNLTVENQELEYCWCSMFDRNSKYKTCTEHNLWSRSIYCACE